MTLGLRLLRMLGPERAHRAAIRALKAGLGPRWDGPFPASMRMTETLGFNLPHPVGLAAGFDKNAEAVGPLLDCGFSFVEVGAVTPRPQPGNPKPRLFRLSEDQAAINRFGFNNDGVEAIRERLAKRPHDGVVGVNLGANKDSSDRAADYVTVLERLAGHADFFTVNVSSPNTAGLRDLQERAALDALMEAVLETRDRAAREAPIFLKVSPDLTDVQLDDVIEVCVQRGVDAIIATNTTLGRQGLRSPHRDEAGGLSGQPLFKRSTDMLRQITEITEGQVPLIGVGGIGSAQQAYAKIRAGACLVQLYTAMSYRGPEIVREIVTGLARLVERDSYASITEAIGADVFRSNLG